jgi:mono/diheme cytochrome c family protein
MGDAMNDDRMSLKFKRLDDPDKQTVMDLYHDNCIACHTNQVLLQQLAVEPEEVKSELAGGEG